MSNETKYRTALVSKFHRIFIVWLVHSGFPQHINNWNYFCRICQVLVSLSIGFKLISFFVKMDFVGSTDFIRRSWARSCTCCSARSRNCRRVRRPSWPWWRSPTPAPADPSTPSWSPSSPGASNCWPASSISVNVPDRWSDVWVDGPRCQPALPVDMGGMREICRWTRIKRLGMERNTLRNSTKDQWQDVLSWRLTKQAKDFKIINKSDQRIKVLTVGETWSKNVT